MTVCRPMHACMLDDDDDDDDYDNDDNISMITKSHPSSVIIVYISLSDIASDFNLENSQLATHVIRPEPSSAESKPSSHLLFQQPPEASLGRMPLSDRIQHLPTLRPNYFLYLFPIYLFLLFLFPVHFSRALGQYF